MLWSAADASAAVDLGADKVVVRTDAARAELSRKPVRLVVTDGEGRRVLGQVPNAAGAPSPVPPTLDPEPFSYDFMSRPRLYTPFAYVVGAHDTYQPCPGGVCGGNQLFGAEGGVEYSAREVVEAKQAGQGALLTLSTNEPSGRQLELLVEPGPHGDSIRVRVVPKPADGVALMAESFTSATDEAFRGFGGRHDALDHRGHEFYSWPEQENSSNEGAGQPTGGGEDYQFPNGPHAAYYPQALFYSSEPYGFLVNQPELAYFRLASEREDAWQFAVAGAHLDYVVSPGPAKTAIKTITDINGRHRVPPEWALGPITSRWIPTGALDPDDVERQIREDLAMIDKHEVPVESYSFYNQGSLFGDETMRDLMGEFRKRGIRSLSYRFAFVDTNEHKAGEPGAFDEAIEKGYYVKTAAGTPYFIESPLIAGTAVMIDFTNPEAVKWWQERIRRNLDFGFDGFMEDFGEQISVDMYFSNGENGTTMHNRYPNLYHAATRPLIEQYEREHPGREIWNYTRSGYSGQTYEKGSAWGEIANFPGDNSADWTQASGLRSAAVDMLSRAVGGAYGYSTDIGGYLGDTPRELFVRWVEWATFSPYFRLHNSSSNGTRQPWFYDEGPTVQVWNKYAALHQRAKPLLMRLFREAAKTGIPPTRPMWLEFPGDAKAAKQEQQWTLGPNLLVAPVVHEGATSREVYFPRGCWQHGETGQRFEGPNSAKVEAPLDKGASLPWFVRCGTDPLQARSAGGGKVAFRLSFRAGRHHGRRCARRVVRGRVVGRGVRRVRRVAFYVDGKLTTRDSRRPFRKRVHRHQNPKAHMNTYEARVTFKDGTTRTFTKEQLGCKKRKKR